MTRSNPNNKIPQIRVYLLGRFRIERETETIQLSTRKTESLLAFLVLNPENHAREKLAALFWGDASDTEARNSLRNSLAVLNKKLGHDLLVVNRQSVQVDPEYPLWVDALEFETQASSFFSNPVYDSHAVDLELYQNDLLIDFYDDWVFTHREHYRSMFLRTLLQMTQQLRSQSEYEQAIQLARKALTFDQVNERAYQHLMFCHMALGDRNAALKQYEECVHVLNEELGVEPSTPTVALSEWIKQTPPEVRPFEARITNLPIPFSSFIGRKHEMTEIKYSLSSTRLLTLAGSGGSGKTRLAIQVGMDLLDSFTDGVWWVDLSSITNDSLVAQSIAKSLGIQDMPGQPLVETIANHTRSKHLLLIIDNCEHVIEESAKAIDLLLKECPHLKIIVTSREALGIPGEQIWNIPTMTLPDPQYLSIIELLMEYEGIRLFVDRAKSANKDFALTEENASFVAQICSNLDGIPLAIELAAARTRLLSPEQIADRLNDRFQLLTSGSRTALPRHQTLQAVIDWSLNLLNDKERLLFQRLAVFSDGWNLEAVEAVCSDEQLDSNGILGLLSNLVNKSLVIKDGEQDGKARYRMLETIKQYAQNVLRKSGAEEKMQERHCTYFLKLANAANPHLGFFLPDAEMLMWINILASDLENIRSALNFCKANPNHLEIGSETAANLHWFWLVNNQLTEGYDWINKLMMESSLSKAAQAQALLSAGFISCWRGDFAPARSTLEKSLGLFEKLGNKAGVAFSLHGQGFAANGLGEPIRAGSLFGKCLEIAKKIDDKWIISFALHFIAVGTSFQGNYDLARSQFGEHIQLTHEGMGNAQGIGFSLFHLGRIDRLQGNFVSAQVNFSESIKLFWHIGDKRGLGYSLFGFACLAQVLEEPDRAARLFGVVDSIRENLGTLLEAILQSEYEQAKAAIQDVLGEESLQTAWSEGYKMTLGEAVQYALTQN
jgi:predicted ATPase/DNA-binding SARP family transcriptional activator